MTLMDKTVTATEIASALNYAPDYFLRIVPDLVANHGMPCRLPSSRRQFRWSRPAVESWLASYHTATPRHLDTVEIPQDIAATRQALRLVYASTAEGARA
jgi:hypothetical protein